MKFRRKKPDFSELPVYMDQIELSQVVAVVEALAPKRCLEWGSGGSTREFLERFPFIEQLVSVEHDPAWHAVVAAKVTDPRLSLHLVQSDVARPAPGSSSAEISAWDDRAEVDAAMMRTYVAFPGTLGGAFDFVLVDGRARNFCAREGFRLLRSGGVLILHDAQRTAYHETVRSLGRAVFLTPFVGGQVCLVRKA